jgi:VIT1/CCC1 family predicted Fe2+/Mn2+ transporter/rubrerythrin
MRARYKPGLGKLCGRTIKHMRPGDQAPREAVDRLLEAWRGEIEAWTVYELIACRERDPKRAEILRRMAEAESGHRRRLEQRMQELDIPVPDPSSVHISPWLRLQARVAPLDRLLAAREAAESGEVDDLYLRPTGDAKTDELLHEIRKDERSHSMAVNEMRSESPPPAPARPAVPPAQARLDRILGREKWHEAGSGWMSGAIYGANDGLAAVFGIVTGVSGATGGSHIVLTAGVAGAVASALSMATGAFLAERSELEVADANVERERQEIVEHPDEEREELSLFYQLKGLDEATADRLAEEQSKDPDAMLRLLTVEELGGAKAAGNPVQGALAAGISTGLGAIIPVIPFIWLTGNAGIVVAGVVSLIAHFAVGAAKSLFTLRSWWSSGLEMTLAGIIVGGLTYAVGLAFA